MRISDNMMTNSILRGINANKSRMNEIQKQLSSGKRIHESSDDPFAFAKSARFKSIIERNDQYLRNINMSLGFVESTQIHLEDINNIIQDAKAKATQAADDSLNAENRDALAQEIDSMLVQLVSLANGNFDGDYLFNGNQVNGNVPFVYDVIKDEIKFNGDVIADIDNDSWNTNYPQSMERNFGEHLEININISGNDFEKLATAFHELLSLKDALKPEFTYDSGLGPDTVTSIIDPNGNLLTPNDYIDNGNGTITFESIDLTTGVYLIEWASNPGFYDDENFKSQSDSIAAQIDGLDTASNDILKLITKIGDTHSRITLTEQQLTLTNMNLFSYMSSLEDVDMAEAVLHYNNEEMAYKVALQAASNMITTSLMDYIR